MNNASDLKLSDRTLTELNDLMWTTMQCTAWVAPDVATLLSAKIGQVIDLLQSAREHVEKAPGIDETDKLWDCLEWFDAHLREAAYLLTHDGTQSAS